MGFVNGEGYDNLAQGDTESSSLRAKLTKSSLILVILIITLLIITVPLFLVPRSSYYVAPNGDDSDPGTEAEPWATVDHAASTVVAGDTVYVKNGIYNEMVTVDNSGRAGNWITFQNYPGHSPVIDGTGVSPPWQGLIHIEDKNYIKISGFTIQDSSSMGISARGNSDHITIENCHVINCVNVGIYAGNDVASADVATNFIIDSNELESCNTGLSEEVISLHDVDGFVVSNNYVHNNSKEGICPKVGCSNGEIYGNISTGNTVGIYIGGRMKGGDYDQDIDIHNNLCYSNTKSDIEIGTELGGRLKNINIYNNIFNSSPRGIHSHGLAEGPGGNEKENITIINNTFYNHSTQGLRFGSEAEDYINNVVRNNIFDCNVGIAAYEDISGADITIDHNLFSGTSDYYGTDYVQGDPEFVNPGSDFHLQSTSPAIDSGSAIEAPDDDFDGLSRPQGTGYDIGSDEYEAAQTP